MTEDIPPHDLEDENRKLKAEIRAQLHQITDLQEELKAQRWFVRSCSAIFFALDNLKPMHAALYATEKARPLAALPAVAPGFTSTDLPPSAK
jgi:hypothetical protein